MSRGVNWNGREAPQMVMAPVPGFPFNVDAFIAHHITDMGFGGILRFLLWNRVSAVDLRLAELADSMGFWVHFVMYGDVQARTAPSNALGSAENKAFQRAVVEDLAAFRNVSVGCGYDNREWVSDNEGNRWVKRNLVIDPDRLFSIRVRPNEKRRDPSDANASVKGYRPGGLCSLEQQILDKSEIDLYCDEAIALAFAPVIPGGPAVTRPVASLDRFRVRPGSRAKDFKIDQIAPAIRAFKKRNVGAAWGIGPNVSDTGSENWPASHQAAIRAALSGTNIPVPPDPEQEGQIMIIDVSEIRSKALRLGGQRGTPEALTWPDSVGQAEVILDVGNTLPWLIVGVHLFIGMEANRQDEITATASIMDGEKARPIAKHIAEKDSTGMAFDASEQIVFVYPYRLPKNGQLRLSGIHWNTGTGDQDPAQSNQPHIEAKFFGVVDRT